MNEANDPARAASSTRRVLLRRWLLPVMACLAMVGVHAYFHVPKGKYAPRPSPEAIQKHRAKLQRHRLERQRAERRVRERQAAERRKREADKRARPREPTEP